ncbi:NAD(P)/FAD-dependent oxidoreductase [Sneathiella limimaris]|uniref:NAD(P)/FAD-dependent oxidoreductase n=1 Tax=Sneathiella limimaris TaxID=1964213 RepID=UPI00146ABA0D|nr:TIGR03862 family flavoprotein [Sneathiella limimaris]
MTAQKRKVVIVGGGPAGLFAAEYLSRIDGLDVHLFDHKPSIGRKFLIAGRGGLNLTHSEELESFLSKYGPAEDFLKPLITDFNPRKLRDWAEGLGVETFVGTSGRVFPVEMKATGIIRAWSKRILDQGVTFHPGYSLTGIAPTGDLIFQTSEESVELVSADATLFAMGGLSYPHLGSTGNWIPALKDAGIDIRPFLPMNCGFEVNWSAYLISKYSGEALKNIRVKYQDEVVPGDLILTDYGLEGGAIYALSRELVKDLDREKSEENEPVVVHLDLKPDMSADRLRVKLESPRGKQSFSNYLRKALGLPPHIVALLHERAGDQLKTNEEIISAVKNLPITLTGARPIERAISSLGGVKLESLTPELMVKDMPGIFVAGEMMDWDAPTGGYLLQACFATGLGAAKGIENYLKK